ncbi:hypothetical protein [Nonomuraea sp. NPDC049141]|uniref:DUF6924 domain-containing protein n=1 Tax=Nonomuraea sp. NPDC049141 TaxID=3155500 RepID=UPI00340CC959
MSLPQPADLTSLVLRTDFSDDSKWLALQALLDGLSEYADATYVSDPAYADVTVQALIEADASAAEDEQVTYLFLADATAIADEEHLLLAVDLFDEPGRTFRVTPVWYREVSANLSIANMDFADYAEGVST